MRGGFAASVAAGRACEEPQGILLADKEPGGSTTLRPEYVVEQGERIGLGMKPACLVEPPRDFVKHVAARAGSDVVTFGTVFYAAPYIFGRDVVGRCRGGEGFLYEGVRMEALPVIQLPAGHPADSPEEVGVALFIV